MYQDKVKYVDGNLETLQTTIERKQENLQVVGRVLQMVSVSLNGIVRVTKNGRLTLHLLHTVSTVKKTSQAGQGQSQQSTAA